MIDMMGVSGRLKVLVDRVTATWAAKLDTLESRLSSGRASAMDTMLSTAVWTATRAGYIDRLNSLLSGVPVTNGLNAGCTNATFLLDDSTEFLNTPLPSRISVTTGTSWTDAVNHTGSGYLEFCIGKQQKDGTNADSASYEIIIDGVTAYASGTFACTTTQSAYHIGAGQVDTYPSMTTGGSTARRITPTLIQFRTSLQIRYKKVTANGSAAAAVFCRYRETL